MPLVHPRLLPGLFLTLSFAAGESCALTGEPFPRESSSFRERQGRHRAAPVLPGLLCCPTWAPHQAWICSCPLRRHQASSDVATSTLPHSPHCWEQDWRGPCAIWHPAGRFAFFRHFRPDRNGVKMVLGETMSPIPGKRALRALRRLLGVPATVGDEENLFPTSLWGFWYTPWWPLHIFRAYTGLSPAYSTCLRGRRVVKSPRGDAISAHQQPGLRQCSPSSEAGHGCEHLWQEPAIATAGPGCRLTPWRAGGDGELELMNRAHWSL